MPTSLRLNGRTERLVQRLAREGDRTKSDVIREAISAYGRQQEATQKKEKSLHETVAPYIGLVEGGPPDLSERTSDTFHDLLVAQANQRRARERASTRPSKKAKR
jgi:Arc/MetJ-type ribon-helix-helix transcriptional regulator